VATQIPGNLEALFREVAAGHPVLILQNLGLSWAPSWHYAVVVGYDLNEGYVILHSGSMKRQELGIRTFEYTWNRSKRWAVVTLRPGQLPVSATEIDVTKALLAFEHNGPSPMAVKAYRSGLARWPDNVTMAMGLGNALFAAGDYVASEKVFAQVAHKHGLVAAYNNQAHVLLKLKRYNAARKVIMQGLAMDDRLRPTLLKTLDEIAAASKRTSRAK
jgi:tetratricopeptide (TPR) repeat protein